MSRFALAEIDLDAFRHNYRLAKSLAPTARAVAVIKANGYGHGSVALARALPEADCFGVASIDEALELRAAGINQPILLLEGFFEVRELPEIAARKLDIVIHAQWQLREFLAYGGAWSPRVWIKVDTGMHRLGIAPDQFTDMYRSLLSSGRTTAIVAMTHFASADDPENPRSGLQAELLRRTVQGAGAAGIATSLANSAAVVTGAALQGDWVRPGIMLYGVNPFVDDHSIAAKLRPVMTLGSRIIAIRGVAAGEGVGYSWTWRPETGARIATVAMGYGDGYPRHAANGTPVLVNGQQADLVGRVSMDMVTVDISHIPAAEVGDPVTFWGRGLPAWEIARQAETIAYELFTGVTARVPRVYRET